MITVDCDFVHYTGTYKPSNITEVFNENVTISIPPLIFLLMRNSPLDKDVELVEKSI